MTKVYPSKVARDGLARAVPLLLLLCTAGATLAQSGFSYDRPTLGPLDQNTGVSAGLAPTIWFWEKSSHTGSPGFDNASNRARAIETGGRVPSMGLQLWNRTYAKARAGDYSDDPAFTAWATWVKARPQYLGRNHHGELIRRDGAGYVSPLVRLDAKDKPPGFAGRDAYFADWQARKISTLAKAGGTTGLFMSDFFDSHPAEGVAGAFGFFHPRMIDDFEARSGVKLAPGSLTQQIAEIRKAHTGAWLEYFVDGWSRNWATLITEMRKQTGKEPLIINQTSFSPAAMRRHGGVDPRDLLRQPGIKSSNILYLSQGLQGFVVKSEPLPESYEMLFTGMHAARTPGARIGQIVSSEEPTFWRAVGDNWPRLSEARQRELGRKRLKRVWLSSGWAHIAMPNGQTRRAVGNWERHYHDRGDIDGRLVKLLQDIRPARPFGPALYYSVGIESKVEAEVKTANTITGGYLGEDLAPATRLSEAGVPINYFASDAIVDNVAKVDAPSAWVIPSRLDALPKRERARLESVAPVLSGDQALKHRHPIRFATSSAGRTVVGHAFYDQKDRLIVVVGDKIKFGERNNNLPGITANVSLDLPGVANGKYTASDLLSKQTIDFTVKNGRATLNVALARWDTRVLALPLGDAKEVSKLSGLSYRIRHVPTDRYLNAAGGGALRTKLNTPQSREQQWYVVEVGNGSYQILSAAKRASLDSAPFGKVGLTANANAKADDQLWELVPAFGNRFYLRNEMRGRDWLAAGDGGGVWWIGGASPQGEAWELIPSDGVGARSKDAEEVTAVSVYPNPASDLVYVAGVSERARVRLSTENGQTLQDFVGNAFDVSHLPSGKVVVHVTDGRVTSSHSLLLITD